MASITAIAHRAVETAGLEVSDFEERDVVNFSTFVLEAATAEIQTTELAERQVWATTMMDVNALRVFATLSRMESESLRPLKTLELGSVAVVITEIYRLLVSQA